MYKSLLFITKYYVCIYFTTIYLILFYLLIFIYNALFFYGQFLNVIVHSKMKIL